MTKVVHIMSGFGGGISSFIKNKASELENSDIIFDVMTYDQCDHDFIRTIEETGGEVIVIPNPKKEGFKSFFTIINNYFKAIPSDSLIHSHIQGYRAIPFFIVARLNNIRRYAIHAHTGLNESNKRKLSSKVMVAMNNFMARDKISCGKKASQASFGTNKMDKIMHIPNSIDEKKYFNETIQRTSVKSLKLDFYGEEHSVKTIIGHVGRFHPVKKRRKQILRVYNP